MSRVLGMVVVLSLLIGCRLAPDQQPLKPLPEDGQVFSYAELLSRARVQATSALEAFYIDAWKELAEAGQGLEQTARFLPRTTDQPAELKDQLILESKQLSKDAFKLVEAAQAQNVKLANEALQQIHLKIRSLRPKAKEEAK